MSSAFSDQPAGDQPTDRDQGPTGLKILAFMGFGMLAGILFLSWLGTPRIAPAAGQPLRQLELAPLAYTEKELSEADLQGKVTLLHFWGTWCPQCMTEFPEFAKVAQELANQPEVQVWSVACSEGPEYDLPKLSSEIRAYLEKQEVQLATFADPAGLTRVQTSLLLPGNAMPYPCTLVLDRQGIVRGTWTGYQPGNMEQARQQALALASK